MPKVNSLSLPYHFRSIGTQQASCNNLKVAPPLIVQLCQYNEDARITTCFHTDAGIIEQAIKMEQIRAQIYHPQSEESKIYTGIYHGEFNGMKLWDALIGEDYVQLCYVDLAATPFRPISGYITLENLKSVHLIINAKDFRDVEPMRDLSCEYDSHVLWGRLISVTEWKHPRGVRHCTFYPNASIDAFERLGNCENDDWTG